MRQEFEALARSLAKAWQTGGTIALPEGAVAPRSRADAFAIQDRIAEVLGERSAGWKVGAAVRAVQVLEGHDGPITGRLFANRLYTHPGKAPAALFAGYNIEAEYALRFETPLPARSRPYTRAEIEPFVVLHAGLEIAGSRYQRDANSRKVTTHDAIADNGAGGGYVLGPVIPEWRKLDLATLAIDARIDGGAAIHTYQGEYRRDPVDIAVETVNGLSERGIGVAAGELLSTGSLTQPTPLQSGQTYVARFGDAWTVQVTFVP